MHQPVDLPALLASASQRGSLDEDSPHAAPPPGSGGPPHPHQQQQAQHAQHGLGPSSHPAAGLATVEEGGMGDEEGVGGRGMGDGEGEGMAVDGEAADGGELRFDSMFG
jgi:hypothetical protein